MPKGSDFEREKCKELSLWWTSGKRDDVFWRSHSSGGRATQRGAKRTAGQYGDITASDPCGQPLIDVLTIELKRGYSSLTIQDILDRGPAQTAQQEWEKFVCQAVGSHRMAGSFAWMVLARRDKRVAWVYMPSYFAMAVREVGGIAARQWPSAQLNVEIRDARKVAEQHSIFATTWTNWLANVTPEHIRLVAEKN